MVHRVRALTAQEPGARVGKAPAATLAPEACRACAHLRRAPRAAPTPPHPRRQTGCAAAAAAPASRCSPRRCWSLHDREAQGVVCRPGPSGGGGTGWPAGCRRKRALGTERDLKRTRSCWSRCVTTLSDVALWCCWFAKLLLGASASRDVFVPCGSRTSLHHFPHLLFLQQIDGTQSMDAVFESIQIAVDGAAKKMQTA